MAADLGKLALQARFSGQMDRPHSAGTTTRVGWTIRQQTKARAIAGGGHDRRGQQLQTVVLDNGCSADGVRPAYRTETGGFRPLRGPERVTTSARSFDSAHFNSPKPTPVGCDRKSEANTY